MTPEAPFALSPGDRATPLWIRLVEHLEKRLQQQRINNDSPDLTEQQTAKIRGHIECLKGLIALGNERPVIPD